MRIVIPSTSTSFILAVALMSAQLWEVVGGSEKAGIVVRAGRDLKSSELGRLSTGALVLQTDLVGERLSFERLTGTGPSTGWVSLAVKGTELVVKSGKELPGASVLACFYSGGMTAKQGLESMEPFVSAARHVGIHASVILDHPGEPGYEDCKGWDDYVARLAAKVDEDAERRNKPVFIVAHSHGSVAAWGLAKRFGKRCQKLYIVARRPPNGGLADEVWGVDSAAGVAELSDLDLLNGMLLAWPNTFLESKKHINPLPHPVPTILKTVRKQYSMPWLPCGSAEVMELCKDAPAIEAPILGIAASKELPRGETLAKMEGWKEFTLNGFELKSVAGDHLGIMAQGSEALDVILLNMARRSVESGEPGTSFESGDAVATSASS